MIAMLMISFVFLVIDWEIKVKRKYMSILVGNFQAFVSYLNFNSPVSDTV